MPKAPKHVATGLYTSLQTVACEICGKQYKSKGIASHRQFCISNRSAQIRTNAYGMQIGRADREMDIDGDLAVPQSEGGQDHINSEQDLVEEDVDCVNAYEEHGYNSPDRVCSAPMAVNDATSGDEHDTETQQWRVDDIMTVYHPHSGTAPTIHHFEDYGRDEDALHTILVDSNPTSKFGSRVEFDLAELILEASMNRKLTDRLLDIIHQVRNGAPFTFRKHTDIETAWDIASRWHSLFEKHVVSEVYNNVEYSFNVWSRDIWQWALDLIGDPNIAQHLKWDARRLFKFDGAKWVPYLHEPWTAEQWWDAQSNLHPDAKPVCFALYADKTRLSSMGHEQGYPVMCRLLNGDVDIRNGAGPGGGRVVGWLPIVPEDEEHKGKTSFVNFKRVIWHKSFEKILKRFRSLEPCGQMFECGNGVLRWLFLVVLLLSADYEEQCAMVLNRGSFGNSPCPTCVVPRDEQSNHNIIHAPRDMEAIKYVVLHPTMTKAAKEEWLKVAGLRNVKNAFWGLCHFNPYSASSFDTLHANGCGLWCDHIWAEFKIVMEDSGRAVLVAIDNQMSALSRWRNLNHFDAVMHIDFNDGTKRDDIAKSLIFAAHHVVTEDTCPLGYLLLRVVHAYLEHTMFLSLEVHTEETIGLGRTAPSRLAGLIDLYKERNPAKNWNFPKWHAQVHAYDNILAKGVTRNFSTKPFEKLHGPLKTAYRLWTNYKNVADQILRIDHYFMTAAAIQANLDILDEHIDTDEDPDIIPTSTAAFKLNFGRVYLGSVCKLTSFEAIETERSDDVAFRRFRLRFSDFVNRLMPHPPDEKWRQYLPENEIQECRFLKVNFESKVTWRQETDYLRCNPKFHGQPRYDGVLIELGERVMFGKLIYVFTCRVDDGLHPFALILPLNAPTGVVSRKDRHLGLYRLRAQQRKQCIFIPVRSIIHGALIVEDPDVYGDYFVMDLVDKDWFLHCRQIFPERVIS